MLGGSFWIAMLRNGMGAVLMMAVFLLLDRPKFPMKRTIWSYLIFILFVTAGFSTWYLLDQGSYIRFAGLASIPAVGIFCMAMSTDTAYISLYKLTLGFYLLSVTVFLGIDASRIWFGGSLWADIIIRFFISIGILFVLVSKVRKNFLDGIDYLREEMDWFSAITVLLSIFIGALVAFWPGRHDFSIFHVVRTCILFFMGGLIQYMVFQLYLHRGKERRYQVEKELLETNERLIRRQMELVNEAKEESARIRHDVRHHCLLMEEYIRNGENEKLLAYVKQYREDIESPKIESVCGNETINGILTVYARWAREKDIQVVMRAKVSGDIAVRDIDLVAVIANIYENAIHGCLASGKPEPHIHISVIRKGKKMVVQCSNTCSANVKLKHGVPMSETGIGISSVGKVVAHYNGEMQFAVEEGEFIVKILLNIPEKCQDGKT